MLNRLLRLLTSSVGRGFFSWQRGGYNNKRPNVSSGQVRRIDIVWRSVWMAKFFFGAGENSPVSLVHTQLSSLSLDCGPVVIYILFFSYFIQKAGWPLYSLYRSIHFHRGGGRKNGQKRQRESWPKRFPACAHRWEYHIEKNKKKKKSLLTRTQFDYEAPLRCKREVVEVTYSKYWGPDGYDESSTLSSGRLKGPSRAATGELAPSYNQTFIFRAPSNAREVGLICSPTYI